MTSTTRVAYLTNAKRLKCADVPIRYAYTESVVDSNRRFFPYMNYWHGDYEWDYPIVDDRKAGYFPRTDYVQKQCDANSWKHYAIPRTCFETGPYTTVPCSTRYDCCGYRCVDRIGSR